MIDNLTFNVAQLLKEPIGAIRNGQVVADLHRLVPELQEATTDEGKSENVLVGPVRLMHSEGGVLVQGSLQAELALPCSRCLEPVKAPLDIELEEVFMATTDILTGKPIQLEEEDRALWIDERHILDLREVLRQEVLVAVPMHVLCRDDCRGLCPNCGQNWNEGSCNCEPEPDPRWSALRDLLEQT